MIAWMLYTLMMGLVVSTAALAGDRVACFARRQTRLVWAGAMLVAIGLPALAPFRMTEQGAERAPAAGIALASTARVAGDAYWPAFRAVISEAQRLLDAPLVRAAAAIEPRVPSSIGAFVAVVWSVLSASLAVAGVLAYARFSRARRRWPVADVGGSRVRVSRDTGPVVIGLARPEIVVPRWVLARDASEQRVVLTHEAEHVRARDGLLLAAGCAAVVMMPWNPALWFLLSRMRLAVELDCDARVLRGGVSATAYGHVLIDVAELALPLNVTAVALANDRTHLHQRILAMKPQTRRFAALRASAAAAIGFVGLLAACEARMPTAAEIQKLDVSDAEMRAQKLSLVTSDGASTYKVDGVVVTRAQAYAIRPDSIASVGIAKQADGSSVLITTRRDAVLLDTARGAARLDAPRLATVRPDTPLVFVDGVRSDMAALDKLKRDRAAIDRVEVLKGNAAVAQYGPEALPGVILITTKSAK